MISRLKIGYRLYGVEWPEDGGMDDDNRWGECDKRRGMIRVSSLQRPPDALAETLVHEILHALIYDAGTEWDDDMEEQVVRLLSPRLAAFIRDNPTAVGEIARMLTE